MSDSAAKFYPPAFRLTTLGAYTFDPEPAIENDQTLAVVYDDHGHPQRYGVYSADGELLSEGDVLAPERTS